MVELPEQDGTVTPIVNKFREDTAIVYFHGIGTPRRHEEISRLADSLDRYAETQEPGGVGRLRKFDVQWESGRAGDLKEIAYVSMTRLVQRFKTVEGEGGAYRREGDFRLYEGYWSSAIAGGFSTIRVIGWFLALLPVPVKVLTTTWRSHQRLRLLSLYRLLGSENLQQKMRTAKKLEELYKQFEGWPARKDYRRGTFREFEQLIRTRRRRRVQQQELIALARSWRWKFFREQLLACIVSLSLLVALAAIIVFALRAIATIQFRLIDEPPHISNFFESMTLPGPTWLTVLIVCALSVIAYKVRYYLRYFLADVMFWTIHQEKDRRFEKRTEIIEAAENILMHILHDPMCKRLVVVGHSLGSAIAYNALVRVGRRETALRNSDAPTSINLERISHFLTIGSPIDIIHYLFDLHQSRHHRFNRIQDKLLGSTSDAPFQIAGSPGTRWINIWDDADLISSRLFSPRRSVLDSDNIVDVLSRSSVWPNPLGAHLNYLISEAAMRTVFWIGMFGRMPRTFPDPDGSSKLVPLTRFAAKLGTGILAWLLFIASLGWFSWQVPIFTALVAAAAWLIAKKLDKNARLIFDEVLKS